jgi:NAD(P)-dependent dehydrogenase (short-subunit alcohol dehydrogenase family)
MKLLGKKAIVTGANRSIGKAIAIAFAKEGADVVISYRSDEAGAKDTISAVEQLGRLGKCIFVVKIFFQQAIEYLGGVDILVNNAGGYDTTAFLELEIDKFESVLKISLSAPMLLTQLAALNMIQSSIAGVIINISSISGNRPYPNRVAHSTAKAALNMLTQATALELAQHNIRVNAIAPGATPYEDDVTPNFEIPIKRMGKPLDQATAALFLASDESSWMTGQVLTIDGGQSLSFE